MCCISHLKGTILMKKLRAYWLEIVFLIILVITIIASIGNFVKYVDVGKVRTLSRSEKTLELKSISEYLTEISMMGDVTAILVVKDIQGYYLEQSDIDVLKAMGFKKVDMLLEQSPHSFIGVWSDGKVLFEQIGGNEEISHGMDINNHFYMLKSATFMAGNVGYVYIDNKPYAVNNRGLNIVTIDNEDSSLIDSIDFDVFMNDVPAYRLVNNIITYVGSTR